MPSLKDITCKKINEHAKLNKWYGWVFRLLPFVPKYGFCGSKTNVSQLDKWEHVWEPEKRLRRYLCDNCRKLG